MKPSFASHTASNQNWSGERSGNKAARVGVKRDRLSSPGLKRLRHLIKYS